MSGNLKYNYEEFSSYLLLYASMADMELTQSEIDLIKTKISEEQYQEIKADFDQANDFERLQTIEKYRGVYFPTAARAQELLSKIVKLFHVDGNFSHLEQNCLRLLNKLI